MNHNFCFWVLNLSGFLLCVDQLVSNNVFVCVSVCNVNISLTSGQIS